MRAKVNSVGRQLRAVDGAGLDAVDVTLAPLTTGQLVATFRRLALVLGGGVGLGRRVGETRAGRLPLEASDFGAKSLVFGPELVDDGGLMLNDVQQGGDEGAELVVSDAGEVDVGEVHGAGGEMPDVVAWVRQSVRPTAAHDSHRPGFLRRYLGCDQRRRGHPGSSRVVGVELGGLRPSLREQRGHLGLDGRRVRLSSGRARLRHQLGEVVADPLVVALLAPAERREDLGDGPVFTARSMRGPSQRCASPSLASGAPGGVVFGVHAVGSSFSSRGPEDRYR